VADNLKAFGDAIYMRGPSVLLRKPGCAGFSAIRTPQIFDPTLLDDHPPNILLWKARPANGARFFDALGLSIQAVERLAEVTGPWPVDNRSPRI
jgi:hypothetical protein